MKPSQLMEEEISAPKGSGVYVSTNKSISLFGF